ncbi:thioesterase II family protein [Streptomyces sp. NPDC057654]|uniref:thioesterase II family protein n=1 Tax=Streptomyces sp. NPDC057654 TaxID=3346196 RepID=UPI0036C6831E
MTGPDVSSARWFRRPRPGGDPSLRLLCLPHAGGTASLYRAWTGPLPDWIEPVLVCPPGREERVDERGPDDVPALVAALADAVRPLLDRPWAVFGHSMGALVAHELALRLVSEGARPPEHVFVSAREAPQFHRPGAVHLLDDDGLAAELLRLGGTHPELLAMDEVRRLILPAVRDDYRLVETYAPPGPTALPCPVTALVGTGDTEVSEDEARGWSRWTDAEFRLLAFTGGHFYFSDDPHDVVRSVTGLLAGSRADGAAVAITERR